LATSSADWLFIGEGPGAEEDARGEPFVGPAGKLLDAMLAAIDLQRGEDVYIANAVKCRPPNNRTPEAAEIATCAPYLKRQIALIQPRLIVLLGRAAAHALLGERWFAGQLCVASPSRILRRRAAGRTDSGGGDLSSGLPVAHPAGQGKGLGGPVPRPALMRHAKTAAAQTGREPCTRPAGAAWRPLEKSSESRHLECCPVHPSVKETVMRLRILSIVVCLPGLLSGCGYNTFQTGDEAIKSAWSEVSTSISGEPTWFPTWSAPCRATPATKRKS
jgi:uracil-DNA glycosylase